MSNHGFFQITQKVFLRNGNDLLVLRDRKTGYGDLPGGRMDEDEFFDDWMESLQRELKEEMGEEFEYEIEAEPFFIHKHRIADGNLPCILLGYRGIYIGGELILSEEHDCMEWVDIKNYDPQPLFEEYMLEAMRKYISNYA